MRGKKTTTLLGIILFVVALCVVGCEAPKAPEHGKAEAPATHEATEKHEAHEAPGHEAAEHEETHGEEHETHGEEHGGH